MSKGFKITVATISLIIVFVASRFSSWSMQWGDKGNINQLISALGPLALIFYVIYLSTKKDLFFWFMVASLALVILAVLQSIYF